MVSRACIAVVALVSLSACAPWHMFSSGPACKQTIDYKSRRVTVGATTVPISSGGSGETIQVGQLDVGSDLTQKASDLVQQFDQLQISQCQAMQGLKKEDRAPYRQLRVQVLADFAFVIRGLGQATRPSEYAGAVTDGRARLSSDSRAAAQVGRQ
ncbi:MAG TPA: hypothetical protein VN848_03915 [Gemmatimonadales bacterium]|nr:hypothetical protein [Gemmatimonadales bacterium]